MSGKDTSPGKGWGKGKDDSPGKRDNPRTSSPRARQICFGYNKGSCTRSECRFAHVCQVCGQAHPAKGNHAGWE